MKDKRGVTITNAFQKKLNKFNRKPNKIRVDKDSKFYYQSMKSWFQDNDIEMYSTHNEGKPAVAERFIRNLKNKIYKYMTSISTSPWELMDPRTKNDSDKTQDIHIPFDPF